MNIAFFGTSEFAAIILQKLVSAGFVPLCVVTTEDKPAGRKQLFTPPPLKLLAEKLGIKTFQPTHLVNSAIAELARQNIDLCIVASYGKILPQSVLDIPQFGTLNVHPSLLPIYRGPSPIQTAILNGEKETGVTIMLVDEKMDHGPIVINSKFKIQNSKFTYTELHNQLAKVGAELLIKTIPEWIEGTIKPTAQDHSKATYTKLLTKEDGKIDWNKPAVYIERQVRALNPWPGVFTLWKGKRVKILKAHIEQGKLVIDELQLEGGKPVSLREFLLGHKDFIIPHS